VNPQVQLKLILGSGCLVLLILIIWAAQAWVMSPQAAMSERIEAARNTLERRRTDLLDRDRLAAQLKSYADRTLGGSQEEVDHALRAALSTLGEASGLSDVAVDTSATKEIASPGRRDFKGAAGKPLRDEVDFIEAPATFRATGTWPQFNTMLHALAAEPWIRQIEGLRVVGKGEGQTVEVTIKVRTVFMPNRSPEFPPDKLAVQWPPALGGASPFMLPPPPQRSPPDIASPSQPATPGWQRWQVTFVGRIEGMDEVHVRAASGGRRQLHPGQELEGCVYLGNRPDADGFDEAAFRRDGKEWLVAPGGSFADRRALAE
jgi:hypothetical protein